MEKHASHKWVIVKSKYNYKICAACGAVMRETVSKSTRADKACPGKPDPDPRHR